MKRPETTECDNTNVRVFDTGRELIIRKLGLLNTLIKKEALEADLIWTRKKKLNKAALGHRLI